MAHDYAESVLRRPRHESSTWLVGSRFSCTLDLETLGEMSLNGVLCMEGCENPEMHAEDSAVKFPSSKGR
jgi:hypothetical protein